MQASRLFIPVLTALGIVGLSGWAVAQTTTTTPAAPATTTETPPTVNPANETTAQRMERERMERERTNAPAGSTGTPMDKTARRDANGNLIARADRN